MAKEKFLLVSLQEDKSKKLAQVLSNDTSRKILDYLADTEATESELAKIMHLPLSTVHYNLQALVDGGLVVAEEFHYSQKGKEILHYKLANKYIIIAPRSTFGIKEKLRSVLPTVLIIGVVALIIHFVLQLTVSSSSLGQKTMQVAMDQAPLTESAAMKMVSVANETVIPMVSQPPPGSEIIAWFLIGAVSALIIFLFVDWLIKRK